MRLRRVLTTVRREPPSSAWRSSAPAVPRPPPPPRPRPPSGHHHRLGRRVAHRRVPRDRRRLPEALPRHDRAVQLRRQLRPRRADQRRCPGRRAGHRIRADHVEGRHRRPHASAPPLRQEHHGDRDATRQPGRIEVAGRPLATPASRSAVCAVAVPCGTAARDLFAKNGVTVRPVTFELDVRSRARQGDGRRGRCGRSSTSTDVRAVGGKVVIGRDPAGPERDDDLPHRLGRRRTRIRRRCAGLRRYVRFSTPPRASCAPTASRSPGEHPRHLVRARGSSSLPGVIALAFLAIPLAGLLCAGTVGCLRLDHPVAARARRTATVARHLADRHRVRGRRRHPPGLAARPRRAPGRTPRAGTGDRAAAPAARRLGRRAACRLRPPGLRRAVTSTRAFGIQLPFTTAGVVLAEAFVAMPFLIITLEGAFRSLDRRYEDAAVTLGASSLDGLPPRDPPAGRSVARSPARCCAGHAPSASSAPPSPSPATCPASRRRCRSPSTPRWSPTGRGDRAERRAAARLRRRPGRPSRPLPPGRGAS